MAIKRDVTDLQDNVYVGAYSRITMFKAYNKAGKDTVDYLVQTWKSKAAYNNEKHRIVELDESFTTLYSTLPASILSGLYADLILRDGYLTGVLVND